VTKEPAFLIGVQSQFAKILTQLKESSFVESAEIGFDEALLGRGCILDSQIEGAALCHVPASDAEKLYPVGKAKLQNHAQGS